MSPRAAWRLERLGFSDVYEYAFGKVDWLAAGLPTVRADMSERRVLGVTDRHPPTCAPGVPVADAARLANADGRPSVVVINDVGIVLGRAGPSELRDRGDVSVESVMQPGPATVRAHEPLDALVDRMSKRGVGEMIVSTPEGRLLGVFYKDEDW
jgi:CBS domain-containing protein